MISEDCESSDDSVEVTSHSRHAKKSGDLSFSLCLTEAERLLAKLKSSLEKSRMPVNQLVMDTIERLITFMINGTKASREEAIVDRIRHLMMSMRGVWFLIHSSSPYVGSPKKGDIESVYRILCRSDCDFVKSLEAFSHRQYDADMIKRMNLFRNRNAELRTREKESSTKKRIMELADVRELEDAKMLIKKVRGEIMDCRDTKYDEKVRRILDGFFSASEESYASIMASEKDIRDASCSKEKTVKLLDDLRMERGALIAEASEFLANVTRGG